MHYISVLLDQYKNNGNVIRKAKRPVIVLLEQSSNKRGGPSMRFDYLIFRDCCFLSSSQSGRRQPSNPHLQVVSDSGGRNLDFGRQGFVCSGAFSRLPQDGAFKLLMYYKCPIHTHRRCAQSLNFKATTKVKSKRLINSHMD